VRCEVINREMKKMKKLQRYIGRMQYGANDGFLAVSMVLILSAVVISIAATIALVAIGEGQASLAATQGEQNLAFVEGCVEDALLKVRASATFGDPTGTPVSIARPEGTCIVTVVSKVGSGTVTWTMNATTNATNYTRTIQAIFSRSASGITLNSWREI
jgi:hypothetical protein